VGASTDCIRLSEDRLQQTNFSNDIGCSVSNEVNFLSRRIITNCSKVNLCHNSSFDEPSYTWLGKLQTEDRFGNLETGVIILKCVLYSVRC
jgi:hypothetical protein